MPFLFCSEKHIAQHNPLFLNFHFILYCRNFLCSRLQTWSEIFFLASTAPCAVGMCCASSDPMFPFHPTRLTLLCSDSPQVLHFPEVLAVVLFHLVDPFFWLILSHLLFLSLQTADLVEVPEEGNSSAGTLDISRKRSNSGECSQARTALSVKRPTYSLFQSRGYAMSMF